MVNHDRRFKQLLSALFIEFIELFLPDLAQNIDRNAPMILLDKEIFTDLEDGETHEVDLVMQVKYRYADTFFLIHTEAQAQNQPNFQKRMFHYFARLHSNHNIPIIPIALFTFDEPKEEQACSYEQTLCNRNTLKFNFDLIQLNRLDWRLSLKSDNKVAAALMAKMKFARTERVRVKLECLKMLVRSKANKAELRLISQFIDNYLQLNAEELKKFRSEISKMNKSEQENIIEVETSWKQEGIDIGIGRGRIEGRLEVLTTLLNRRLGPLSPQMSEMILQLKEKEITELTNNILDFSSIQDLDNWIKACK